MEICWWSFGLFVLLAVNQMQLKTNWYGQEIKQPWWRSLTERGICCVKEEATQNSTKDAVEIMQGDFQSSGIFCFATTKRISITFAWISGAVLGDCVRGWFVCVYIKILFGQGQSSQGFVVISAALESQVGFNYFHVNIRKLVFRTDFCLLGTCFPVEGPNQMHKFNIHIPESCRVADKHIDFSVLMAKHVGTL